MISVAQATVTEWKRLHLVLHGTPCPTEVEARNVSPTQCQPPAIQKLTGCLTLLNIRLGIHRHTQIRAMFGVREPRNARFT